LIAASRTTAGSEGAGCGISGGTETVRVQHGGLSGPPDDHYGRGFVGLDELDSDGCGCC
jgi:hypothetical protein